MRVPLAASPGLHLRRELRLAALAGDDRLTVGVVAERRPVEEGGVLDVEAVEQPFYWTMYAAARVLSGIPQLIGRDLGGGFAWLA